MLLYNNYHSHDHNNYNSTTMTMINHVEGSQQQQLTGLKERSPQQYLSNYDKQVCTDIENWNFFLDLKIIYKTIINALTGEEGAY